MLYILQKGIELESEYGKYNNLQGNCKAKEGKFKLPNFCYMQFTGTEEILFTVLDKYEVAVAVAMYVQNSFVSYSSGIYDDTTCSTDPALANHAVVGEARR